jgi:membrane protein implicated in regulation of membrane protease activity
LSSRSGVSNERLPDSFPPGNCPSASPIAERSLAGCCGWWLLAGALLGAAEAVTRRLFFGPAALGALAGAAVAGAGGRSWLQAGAFAVIVAAGLAARSALLGPYHKAVVRQGRMAGTATVVEQVNDHAGLVRYGGKDWAARSFGTVIPPGARVGIAGMADDSAVRVYPKDAGRQPGTGMGGPARPAPAMRVTWREASAARGKLTGGYLLAPEERLRLLEVSLARWRYTDRLFGRALLYCAGLGCALVVAAGAVGLPSALRAARGDGVRGVFTAQSLSCSKACFWTGTFTSGNGQVRPDVTYDDELPATTHPGSIVPALYPGSSNEVFAVRGSTTWLMYIVLISLASAGLLASLWLGPIRYLRRRQRGRVTAAADVVNYHNGWAGQEPARPATVRHLPASADILAPARCTRIRQFSVVHSVSPRTANGVRRLGVLDPTRSLSGQSVVSAGVTTGRP